MRLDFLDHDGVAVAECAETVPAAGGATDLVAACLEHGVDRLLLESRHLPPPFFDLRTGFAGELLQKLQNYQVREAGVFPSEEGYGDRIRELLLEARRSRGSFRVFATRDEALAWLARE
jgi:hypothetical protein